MQLVADDDAERMRERAAHHHFVRARFQIATFVDRARVELGLAHRRAHDRHVSLQAPARRDSPTRAGESSRNRQNRRIFQRFQIARTHGGDATGDDAFDDEIGNGVTCAIGVGAQARRSKIKRPPPKPTASASPARERETIFRGDARARRPHTRGAKASVSRFDREAGSSSTQTPRGGETAPPAGSGSGSAGPSENAAPGSSSEGVRSQRAPPDSARSLDGKRFATATSVTNLFLFLRPTRACASIDQQARAWSANASESQPRRRSRACSLASEKIPMRILVSKKSATKIAIETTTTVRVVLVPTPSVPPVVFNPK